MIKTKSVYEPKDISDGTRVLITRYYPRGIRKEHFDRWIKELSPSSELLKEFKNGKISQVEFSSRFFSQIYSCIESLESLHSISEIAKYNDVTLLCYEKEGEFCHRHLVSSLVRREIKG